MPQPYQQTQEPATCTVELVTGSFVHLACPPSAVQREREGYARGAQEGAMVLSPLVPFRRITGPSLTGWAEVLIDVTQVVAVYAINAKPEPPMVYSILAAGGMVPQGA